MEHGSTSRTEKDPRAVLQGSVSGLLRKTPLARFKALCMVSLQGPSRSIGPRHPPAGSLPSQRCDEGNDDPSEVLGREASRFCPCRDGRRGVGDAPLAGRNGDLRSILTENAAEERVQPGRHYRASCMRFDRRAFRRASCPKTGPQPGRPYRRGKKAQPVRGLHACIEGAARADLAFGRCEGHRGNHCPG